MNNNITSFSNSGTYKLDQNSSKLLVKSGQEIVVDLVCDFKEMNLEIEVEEDAKLTFRILNFTDEKTIVLNQKVSKNGVFSGILADFASSNLTLKSVSELDGEGAKASFYFSTLSKGNSLKDYDISFNHNVKNTKSKLEGYGVCEDESQLYVNGISHIKEGSIKSETSQKIKGILFDETSIAKANPILKIDCDDIIASHACAIGNLNDNHIFYLLTRGISLENARRLITTGYLNPIKEYFDDEDKERISQLIEVNF